LKIGEKTLIVLVGNKSDLEEKREVMFETAKQWADNNYLVFFEASAKTGHNTDVIFQYTARFLHLAELNKSQTG
jgi:GTPase SAR1 family protein